MTPFLITALLGLVLQSVGGVTDINEIKVALVDAREKCIKEAPVASDVLMKILNDEMTVDKNSTFIKYIFCTGKEIRFQNTDGTFNTLLVKEDINVLLGTHDLDDFIDECGKHDADHPPDDALEHSLQAFLCMRRVAGDDVVYMTYGYLNQFATP